MLPAAVSDQKGICSLYLSEQGKASSSLRGDGIAQTVISVALDSLLDHFAAPQVLKIDVEGMEYAVLSGARRVLAARPHIFCEVTDHHEAIGQLLKEANYQFYAARGTNRQPLLRPSRDTISYTPSILTFVPNMLWPSCMIAVVKHRHSTQNPGRKQQYAESSTYSTTSLARDRPVDVVRQPVPEAAADGAARRERIVRGGRLRRGAAKPLEHDLAVQTRCRPGSPRSRAGRRAGSAACGSSGACASRAPSGRWPRGRW